MVHASGKPLLFQWKPMANIGTALSTLAVQILNPRDHLLIVPWQAVADICHVCTFLLHHLLRRWTPAPTGDPSFSHWRRNLCWLAIKSDRQIQTPKRMLEHDALIWLSRPPRLIQCFPQPQERQWFRLASISIASSRSLILLNAAPLVQHSEIPPSMTRYSFLPQSTLPGSTIWLLSCFQNLLIKGSVKIWVCPLAIWNAAFIAALKSSAFRRWSPLGWQARGLEVYQRKHCTGLRRKNPDCKLEAGA